MKCFDKFHGKRLHQCVEVTYNQGYRQGIEDAAKLADEEYEYLAEAIRALLKL